MEDEIKKNFCNFCTNNKGNCMNLNLKIKNGILTYKCMNCNIECDKNRSYAYFNYDIKSDKENI